MHKANDTRQCLICHEFLDSETHLFSYLYHPQICQQCIQQFEILEINISIQSYPVFILYRYNDFFKKILFQYKALDDYALKDVFLCCFPELKSRFKHHVIVIVPSSEKDNKRRGFSPNEEIAKGFSNCVFNGLYKINNYKQTRQKDRTLIRKILRIKAGSQLRNKKVLIFDDVMTSSNTIQATIALIEKYNPQSIEILVLSSPHIHSFLNK